MAFPASKQSQEYKTILITLLTEKMLNYETITMEAALETRTP